MMKYYEDLTPEQRADLAGRRASYESAQRRLKDPVFMARLWAQMAELDARPPAPRLTREEFLAQFADVLEG